MSWCLQCGAEGRPTRATGVDEDGEPACVGHAVKELGAGLNAAAGGAPAVLVPIKQPTAAPSPVQTKAEDEMETRICTGYCGPCPKQQELGRLNRTGICSVCYARRKYAEKYSAAAKGKKPKPLKLDRGAFLDAPKECELKPAGGVYVERMQTAPVNEHVIDLQLSLRQTQVERLIKLLL